MSLVLTIALVSVTLFSWVCLFKIIPDCLLSMFRYRLWRQRDELADEIREGAFDHDEAAREILHRIECYIRLAPQLSPLHIGLMRLSLIGVEIKDKSWIPDLSALSEAEQKVLLGRLEQLAETIGNHVLLETPTGWATILFGLILLPFALIYERIRDGHGEFGKLVAEARQRASDGSSELAERRHFNGGLTSQHV